MRVRTLIDKNFNLLTDITDNEARKILFRILGKIESTAPLTKLNLASYIIESASNLYQSRKT